jgi:hypothetical protein
MYFIITELVDRGYQNIVERLQNIGADISGLNRGLMRVNDRIDVPSLYIQVTQG